MDVGRFVRGTGLTVLALALLSVGVVFAEDGVSISLPDPVTGKTQEIRHGSAALHVVFFATWCPHCVDELDALSDLHARWQERGYRLVVIAVQDRHDMERLKQFADRENVPGRLVFDEEGVASTRLSADDLPTHIVFDADGKEIHRSTRLSDETVSVLRSLLSDR
ncbi:MAG: TlpA family protein disulfide reductase [Acidobacteriota bacterium]|nr:TlpA family protein disulfide reductase [Acidobacteriota bacterium]